MAPAPVVEAGFFPLDEELALEAGSLTPQALEWLARLATWMPFRRAIELLEAMCGVQVSEETARRQTERAGAAYEQVQTQEAKRLQRPEQEVAAEKFTPAERQVVSSDGAFVQLQNKVWIEVKTLVIAQQQRDAEQRMQTLKLSYFSRRAQAENFEDLALVETRRRGTEQAREVAAVMDGALWLQGLIDVHCPEAVRILDFPHAAQRLGEIADAARGAGTKLAEDWLSRQLHQLKHEGPSQVLKTLRALRRRHPELEKVQENLAYLEKREALMQYPRYQQQEWPIGSGMVESAHKQVVQTRLKGAGMRWAEANVNPMLALRNAVCNDRWQEAWSERGEFLWQQKRTKRQERSQQRLAQQVCQLLVTLTRLCAFAPPLVEARAQVPPPVHTETAPVGPKATPRPSATHPWKGRCLPRRQAG
jgi:hypothetical protein